MANVIRNGDGDQGSDKSQRQALRSCTMRTIYAARAAQTATVRAGFLFASSYAVTALVRPCIHPSPEARANTEDPDAETSRPHAIRLFAHRRAERLHLAGRQAARLLCRAQHRAFRLRRRAG